jgi:hypothetical protein
MCISSIYMNSSSDIRVTSVKHVFIRVSFLNPSLSLKCEIKSKKKKVLKLHLISKRRSQITFEPT